MNTYRQLIYMCMDLAKALSDDATLNENHVAFLLNKYRAIVLAQKYKANTTAILDKANYQSYTIAVSPTTLSPVCTDSCMVGSSSNVLKSNDVIPTILSLAEPKLYAHSNQASISNPTITSCTMVSPERFEYVGENRWLKNTIYGTIEYDKYLYLKSANPNFITEQTGTSSLVSDIKYVTISAVYEDPSDIVGTNIDAEFPLEEALVTTLMTYVLRELVGASMRPKDDTNNAHDDLGSIYNFISNALKDKYARRVLNEPANEDEAAAE